MEINMSRKVLISSSSTVSALLAVVDASFVSETGEKSLVFELKPNENAILVIEDGDDAKIRNDGAESVPLSIEGGEFVGDDGERTNEIIYLESEDTIRVDAVGDGWISVTDDDNVNEQEQTGTENEGSETD